MANLHEVLGKLRSGELNVDNPEAFSSFLFPRCLFMPGLLHMLWNALEETLTSADGWDAYVDNLRAVMAFLTDRPLRQRFVHTCMQAAPRQERELVSAFSKKTPRLEVGVDGENTGCPG